MRTVELGNGVLEVTPIGLGCMQFGGPGRLSRSAFDPLDQATVTRVVAAALDGGVRWFDTAEAYGLGHSERALTTALRECRVAPGEVAIATKWLPFARTARHLTRSIDQRLACLQGYPIDLYQIHEPFTSRSSLKAQLRALAALHRAGRVGAVGVSNFSARRMELAHAVLADEDVPLAANQVQINLLHRTIETNGVLDAARRLGVSLIAYSPLASGYLTGRFHHDPAQAERLRPMRRLGRRSQFSPAGLARAAPLIEALEELGASRGASAGQIALAWLITWYGDTVVAIPGASSPRQAAESAAAGDITLTPEELGRLDELSRLA